MKIIVSVVMVVVSTFVVSGQSRHVAFQMAGVAVGNHLTTNEYGILNDFEVVRPVTISALGMFDSGGDGVQGPGTVSVQLYQKGGRKLSLLLETVSFDAANPGERNGAYRFKALGRPVTLWPGTYTLTANGFDELNLDYNGAEPAGTRARVLLDDGGGWIRFLGCNRYHQGDPMQRSKQVKHIGPADRFGAGSFIFSAAGVSSALDYGALTAGVSSYPVDAGKSNIYGSKVVLNRYGSLALLEDNAFAVIAEPSGSRLIFEAAGSAGGARAVAFAHEQWGHALSDGRGVLFENAIKWASRKSDPKETVLGLSTNLNAEYFRGRGYQVRLLDRNMKTNDANPMVGCDAVVVDFQGPYTERFMSRLGEFTAGGGGLVATFLPWRYVHGEVRPMFGRVNALLKPFGMAYRASLTGPADYGFTNIAAVAYPGVLYNGFPAARLLRAERQGEVQLSSLEKAIAMHTIAYAADGQRETLAALSAAYAGPSAGSVVEEAVEPSRFVDAQVLTGAQANGNRLGQWRAEGEDLIAVDTRGSVEYDLLVPTADVYRLQVLGRQNLSYSARSDFDLVLGLDGVRLGKKRLVAAGGAVGKVELLTPFLSPGAHKLRVFWDNAGGDTQLRLQGVRLQTALGTDTDDDGIKDWVESLVERQSGLEGTNEVEVSYVSPVCLEGHDPYSGLIRVQVSGADENVPALRVSPGVDGHWYVNVPLASDGESTFQVSYQNGAKSQTRQLQWLPVNVLKGGSYTVRKGDSLLLTARPERAAGRGRMQFTIGTNQYPARAAAMPHGFYDAGTTTVSASYTSADGLSQSGTITVKVVEHKFTNNPACWVGSQRDWDLSLPADAAFQADGRLMIQSLTRLSGEANGWHDQLLIDENEPRYVVSRLGGVQGPVLDSGAARGFYFWHGKDTYLRAKAAYEDGSQLVEMLLVQSPVLPDVTARVDLIVGGVVFEDGTISRVLSAADFDAQGRAFIRFIRPASAKTSVCHSVYLFQGSAPLGSAR